MSTGLVHYYEVADVLEHVALAVFAVGGVGRLTVVLLDPRVFKQLSGFNSEFGVSDEALANEVLH